METVAAVVPELVTVTVLTALVVPVVWLPKATEVGLSASVTAASAGSAKPTASRAHTPTHGRNRLERLKAHSVQDKRIIFEFAPD
jgi:hypothetical protein